MSNMSLFIELPCPKMHMFAAVETCNSICFGGM